jgi:hypothetical protein
VSEPRPGSESYWSDLRAQHGTAETAVRSSLVDGKNNSRAPEPRDAEQSRLSTYLTDDEDDESHRYDCRETYRNFELEADDGETAAYRCGSWDCFCCAHRMRHNLIEEMERVVSERPELRRFLTLTVDTDAPGGTAERHEYITERWNALRTELNDRYPGLSYIWVRHEGDEKGRPHLHLLVDRYLPQSMLSMLSKRVGLGEVVDIRRVNARNAAKYLTSYLGKGALASLPKGLRRYGSSSDISLAVRGGGGDERDWQLLMDDYEIAPVDGDGPLRRVATKTDIWLQKQNGGPLGVPPPD